MMKRRYIFYAFFSFLIFQSFSQDTLFLRNGEIIPVKVIKVGENEVKLKKLTEFDSPNYFYQNEEISLIKYHDGAIVYYDQTKKPINASKYYSFPKITYIKRNFYLTSEPNRRITFEKFLVYAGDLSIEKKIPDLELLVYKMEQNDKRKKAFSTLGGITLGIGLGAAGLGLIFYDGDANLQPLLFRFGSVVGGISVGLNTIAIVNEINKRKRSKEAIELYNKHRDNL